MKQPNITSRKLFGGAIGIIIGALASFGAWAESETVSANLISIEAMIQMIGLILLIMGAFSLYYLMNHKNPIRLAKVVAISGTIAYLGSGILGSSINANEYTQWNAIFLPLSTPVMVVVFFTIGTLLDALFLRYGSNVEPPLPSQQASEVSDPKNSAPRTVTKPDES